jgi:hypothetical protein
MFIKTTIQHKILSIKTNITVQIISIKDYYIFQQMTTVYRLFRRKLFSKVDIEHI